MMKDTNILLFFLFLIVFLFISIFWYDLSNYNFVFSSVIWSKVWQLILIWIVLFILGKKIIDEMEKKLL